MARGWHFGLYSIALFTTAMCAMHHFDPTDHERYRVDGARARPFLHISRRLGEAPAFRRAIKWPAGLLILWHYQRVTASGGVSILPE